MTIKFDFDSKPGDVLEISHTIDTNDPFPMGVIRALVNGTQKIEGTGWDVITHHPSYPGKTRLHAVVEEIKKAGVKL